MTANFLNSIPLLLVRSPARALTYALMMLAGLLTVVVQTQASAQGTTVSGIISATTTWTTAASPYRISADLSVAPGVTLTMQPGVTIVFNAGVNFTINGGVIAKAAAGQPIIFTSAKDLAGQTPAPGDWGQIRIINGSNTLSDFDGVEFRYGSGLVISGASPLLNRIAIRNMAGPAITVDLAASPRGVDISASGNTLNGISVPAGDISGNITWAITGIPYVLQSGILGVGASASISSISPNVFAIGQTADATIIGNGLTTVESLSSDRVGVSVTLRPGAWQSAIPITVTVPADATPGSAIITAVVGAGTVSVPITITSNLPPLVTLTAPQTGAEYTAPATVPMSATASSQNANGSIRQVDFYQGSTFIRTATTPVNGVYSADWNEAPAGTYNITARAIDNFGAITSSAPVAITIFPPPSISLTSPIPGLFASPGVIAFRAIASSTVPGITIAKVEFLNWGFQTTISTVTTPQNGVYSYDWNFSSGGYNEVRARATDSRGAVSYTSIIVLTGITPPDVSITAPTNNAIFIAPAALTISASSSSIWGPSYAVTIAKVEFYENGNLIGTANTGTGGVFSIAWTKSVNGAYAITAKATDSVGGTKVSSPITIKVGSAPTVTLTAPTEGAAFAVGTTIPLNATAAVQFVGGTIAKVEFFSGTTLIATTTTGGAGGVYSANWIGATAGNYAITAKATDDQGQTSISNAASIQVNAPPSITLTSPNSNTVFNAPATVSLSATASSSNNAGSVSKVEFFQGTTLIGTATTNVGGVFTASWENVAAGNYSITAKATDNTGLTRVTSGVSIQVNAPPVVTITAPANNAGFNPGQLIALRATATTPNTGGTIAKVEFFQGATLIGTATSAVAGIYGFDWINSIGGSYSITATATDAAGLTAVSAPILLRTNNTPSVAIAYPANGAIISVGSQINGTATSNNSGATISKVEFFAGAELIGSASTASNGLYYANLPPNLVGILSITARATDSLGAVATSQAISATAKLKPIVSITSPIDNATFLSSTPITLKATATSPNPGSTINSVGFYNYDTGASIGSGVFANGEYAYSISGFASGTYRIIAYAYDSDAIFGSASPVTILAIDPPAVAITAPINNASFVAPATIALTASATSPNAGGSITKVEFFQGNVFIGQATSMANDSYTYNWTNVATGSYAVTAKATDNFGNITTSQPVSMQVLPPPSPLVSIESPSNNALYFAPASVSLVASASSPSPGGSIVKVELFQSGTLLGEAVAGSNNRYTYSWTNVPTGTYVVTAKAIDNFGNTTTSQPIAIQVSAPLPVAITAPATNTTFAPSSAIPLAARVTTPANVTISKVEFFQGAVLIGQVETGVDNLFQFDWQSVPIGTYSVTAKVTDSAGATSISTPIVIVVASTAFAPMNITILTPAGQVPTVATKIIASSAAAPVCTSGALLGTIQSGAQTSLSSVQVDVAATSIIACQGGLVVAYGSASLLAGQAQTIALKTTSLTASVVDPTTQVPNAVTKIWLKRSTDITNNDAILLGQIERNGITQINNEAIPVGEDARDVLFATINEQQVGSTNPTIQIGAGNTITLSITLIKGVATFQDGSPVANALVSAYQVLQGAEPVTGAAIVNATTGEFEIYGAATGSLYVTAQDPASGLTGIATAYLYNTSYVPYLYLVLQASGKVTGVVTNAAGQPMPSVEVLLANSVISIRTFTNNLGRYAFSNVALGNFDLEVSSLFDYLGKASGILSTNGQAISVDIVVGSVVPVSGLVSRNGVPVPAANVFSNGLVSRLNGNYNVSRGPTDNVGAFSMTLIPERNQIFALDPLSTTNAGIITVDVPAQGLSGLNILLGNAVAFAQYDYASSSLNAAPYNLRPTGGAESYPVDSNQTIYSRLYFFISALQPSPLVGPISTFSTGAIVSLINSDKDELTFGGFRNKDVVHQRRIYVPAIGSSYARVIDTVTNVGTSNFSLSYSLSTNGIGGGSITGVELVDRGESSPDRPYLNFVRDGVGLSNTSSTLQIPAGQTVSVMSFLVARPSCNAANDPQSTCIVADAAETATRIYNGTQTDMYKGLSAADRSRIINFAVPAL